MRVETIGVDRGRGNLLGVEPRLSVEDYRRADRLESTLDACLQEARGARLLGERTVAVFPEYIGAWLVVAGETARVFQATVVTEAMRAVALRHPFSFLRRLAFSQAPDRVTESLFRLKAASAAAQYQGIFSGLARRYQLTIVAGSIILPSPIVSGGRLRTGDGPLANVAAVFRPDGAIDPRLVLKCHPTADELRFIRGGAPSDLPAFDASAGTLGVLVCADSWFPDCWARMQEIGAEMVAVVSFCHGDGTWALPWGGYSGSELPSDVDASDVGRLTEGEAWRKYALAGRIGSSAARCGINVFLRGQLWDLGSDGGTTLVRDGEVRVAGHGGETISADAPGGSLANCWL